MRHLTHDLRTGICGERLTASDDRTPCLDCRHSYDVARAAHRLPPQSEADLVIRGYASALVDWSDLPGW